MVKLPCGCTEKRPVTDKSQVENGRNCVERTKHQFHLDGKSGRNRRAK